MKKAAIILFVSLWYTAIALSQQTTLRGIIKNTEGLPILGAAIEDIHNKVLVLSDSSGKFSMEKKDKSPVTIKVVSVGYETRQLTLTEIPVAPLSIILQNRYGYSEVVITSRRRMETAQSVPLPIAVIGGKLVADAGSFNVNRLKELIPSVQLYSSNPRNTTLNIRGLGSAFGLTNDGLDPGVGFYVDGVYYARPAATTLDFIDVDRIEVLRGPQGTLFGKNTTAGAFNIITKAPSFTTTGSAELSYGNYGYIQAKAAVSGPILKKLAGRLSFSGTQRDGLLYNVATQEHVNDLNNLGIRGQLLFTPSDKVNITLAGDATRQRPVGYAQVVAAVVPTLRSDFRQFNTIIADLGYQLPSTNPFDRLIDQNTSSRSNNDLGGVSLNVDAKIGKGTLTSTTAWRYWKWDPSSDRDYTGLDVLHLSQATSKHHQWTQEVRYAGNISNKLSGVLGAFFIAQNIEADPYQIEEVGKDQWRFSQPSATGINAYWATPGLLDGYGTNTYNRIKSIGAAVFTNIDWAITDRIHLLPGLRYNYDKKDVVYSRTVFGGLQEADVADAATWHILDSLKKTVYSNQAFAFKADEGNFSGQLTLNYKVSGKINAYATYATSYKPLGVNVGGLPTKDGQADLSLARVKPEKVYHFEAGIKTNPTANSTLNLSIYNTNIKDFQTTVQSPEVGVNRGYLANAEKVRTRGIELEGNAGFKNISFYGALSYTEGKYISFKNAPLPLEETGLRNADGIAIYYKDISGSELPGISKWAGSLGTELTTDGGKFLGQQGVYFLAIESYARSSFSSNPTPSAYLNIAGYALFNARVGFRPIQGVTLYLWGRNILNKNYYEQLLVGAGNAGQVGGVLGDPRTYGITLRYTL